MLSEFVSIIIPLYNYGSTLEDTIKNILQQTYTGFEIIIVDDASTDNSLKIAKKLVKKYQEEYGIYLYENKVNAGLTRTRHAGICYSSGEFVMFLDPDGDKIDPTYLEKLVPVLVQNPEIGFVFCDTEYYGDRNQIFKQPEYNFYNLVIRGNFISYCSLIRKSAYYDCGGFNLDNFSYWEDYEFWIKAGRRGWYGKHLPEKLFNYFTHSDSAIHSGFTAEAQSKGLFQAYFIKKYPEIYPPEYQEQADKILEGVPENFISLSKKENEIWFQQWKKTH